MQHSLGSMTRLNKDSESVTMDTIIALGTMDHNESRLDTQRTITIPDSYGTTYTLTLNQWHCTNDLQVLRRENIHLHLQRLIFAMGECHPQDSHVLTKMDNMDLTIQSTWSTWTSANLWPHSKESSSSAYYVIHDTSHSPTPHIECYDSQRRDPYTAICWFNLYYWQARLFLP